MSNFTKEQLIEKLKHRISVASGFPDSEKAQMDLELARIALASLEAEAVALRDERSGSGGISKKPGFNDLPHGTPLYAAPPAPVALPVQHWEELCRQNPDMSIGDAIIRAAWWNHCAAMLQGAENAESPTTMQTAPSLDSSQKIAESPSGNYPVIPDCSCGTCRPVTFTDSRFVVCSECGNKRCPHANDHRNACTGSNEPGQEGGAYPAAPQQEVK
ncbi:hypothetical protein [Enterobacter hormaechei]|uniref:hypothetical protein n=1 Tax=Enterobacter hormaechei TaxID=158836 RepID=UPI00215A4016|nr:hypothetical protein [Enterobacter hormaechei]